MFKNFILNYKGNSSELFFSIFWWVIGALGSAFFVHQCHKLYLYGKGFYFFYPTIEIDALKVEIITLEQSLELNRDHAVKEASDYKIMIEYWRQKMSDSSKKDASDYKKLGEAYQEMILKHNALIKKNEEYRKQLRRYTGHWPP